MRKIGTLEDWERAETFAGYLERSGISARCEPAEGGGWEVWVEDEERVAEGRALYSRYLSMPGAEEFQRVREELDAAREAREEVARRGKVRPGLVDGVGFVCVALWFAQRVAGGEWVSWLGFDAAAVKAGEVWRMLTPALWHADFLGLIVNVWFLRWFGRPLEREIGALRTGMLAVAAAVAGVLGEAMALSASGADAAAGTWGLTGVVYGFYAYEWMRWRREGLFEGAANSSFALVLVVWMAAGLFGVFGAGMPAGAGAGLLTGLLWGLGDRKKRRAGC